MWSETAESAELIQEISMNIVSEVAPEELELFDELMQEYFSNPNPPAQQRSESDDTLGFGLSEFVVAATPAAAAMASAVLSYLVTEVIKAGKDEGAGLIKKKIKALFNRGGQEEKAGPPPLTKEQLEQVNLLAGKQALAFGMEANLSEQMANALIGSLALAE